MERYALAYSAPDIRLRDVGPMQIAEFIGWLCRQPSRRGGTLADRSVRNALKPVRIVLATARREGLIAHNPASEAVLPHREDVDDDDELPRPFLGDTMELVVSLIHHRHREMFELLAATGVRRSELLAFEVRHVALNGDRPHVKVRLRVRRRKGTGLMVGPLKSRHARRDLPIPLEVADRLRPRVAGRGERELVCRSTSGTILDPDNLANRSLAPACSEAGAEWAGFHTFRHTVASRLFAEGRNVVQVQRWLGHHSPSFTIDTYVHLLSDDLGEPLAPLGRPSVSQDRSGQVKKRSSEGPEIPANGAPFASAKTRKPTISRMFANVRNRDSGLRNRRSGVRISPGALRRPRIAGPFAFCWRDLRRGVAPCYRRQWRPGRLARESRPLTIGAPAVGIGTCSSARAERCERPRLRLACATLLTTTASASRLAGGRRWM